MGEETAVSVIEKAEIIAKELEHFGILASIKLPSFYNKLWELGKLPAS